MATLSSTGRFAAGEACADNDILYGPYATIAAAHAALLNAEQNVVGRTVGIQTGNTIEEYWYQGGTDQLNLVKKQTASVEVDSELSSTSENPVQNKVVKSALDTKGTYSKPSGGIPKTDLASGVQTSLDKADTALQQHQDISGKQDKSNIRTSFQTTPDDAHYPSEKLVKDSLDLKAPSTDIAKSALASGVQTSLDKADSSVQNITRGGSTLTKTDGVVDIPEEIEEVVATPVAPGGSPSATLSNGTLTLGLVSGADGHNPNLGTFDIADISNAPTPTEDGDYIVVIDADAMSPRLPKEIYLWDGDSWEPTGEAPTATFASGEVVSNVSIEDNPTQNTDCLVESKGIYDAFKDISKNYNAIAILSGTVSSYGWWTENGNIVAVNIPSGCVVKNVGDVNVSLYEQEDPDYGVHILSKVNSLITTTSTYIRIRGTANAGNFKLFIYADTDIPNLIPTIEKNNYINGTKYFSQNISAYVDYTLPFTIPVGTHIIVGLEGDNSYKTWSFNYDTANYHTANSVGDLEIFSTQWEISKIKCTKAGTLFVKFVNDDFITETSDNSITPSKIEGEHIKSLNLFNKETVTDGYYINQDNGYPSPNSVLCYSDYIPVSPETNYYAYPTANQKAFYDKNKNYISGAAAGASITTPANAKFMRVSVKISDKDTEIINQGTATIPYVPYYDKVRNFNIIVGIDEQSLNSLNTLKPITSRLWNGYVFTTESSLSNGNTITLTDYPKALKKGDKISFTANITSWGDGITIGKGVTDYSAAYAVINSTQIILKSYASGNESTWGTVSHGLTLDTYIKVIIDIDATKWKFIVQTLTDTFTTEINCAYSNGTPRVTSNGASLTDIEFSATNSDFARPIWMFGDSYFGINVQIRELYWLNEWGYLNTLVQGYAGQGSLAALADLQRCIAISKPKYIVWCLGMNDNSSLAAWQGYVAQVRAICDTYGITLILGTIPQALDTETYKYKDAMSTWIREESGCRYIDVAKAVGSNAQGQWYGYGETYDYQSTDNVHPSVYGAKAIATQFLIDFPEIMQY